MTARLNTAAIVLAALLPASVALAQCPPDCPVKGGGDAASDCHAELASEKIRVNTPFYNPAKPKPAKEIRCFDGDPGCDLDGAANNSCTFDVDVCLRNADPSLPTCTAADVTAVTVDGDPVKFPGLGSLQTAIDALLPAAANVCTSGQQVVLPLKGPSGSGEYKASKLTFGLAATAGTVDEDGFRFVCVPRGWPSHGYDATNARATPLETMIDASNVGTLVQKWNLPIPTAPIQPNGKSVTSTITVGPKLVYASSWNGRVYAIGKKNGKVKWAYDTGSALVLGVQSSVTVTADGRVLVGDSNGKVHCLDGKKGTLLWDADAGSADPSASHAWASPLVVGNRVLMGIASHNDSPCTRGVLVALDLDDGSELWRRYTVPERICFDDTTNECSANADCVTAGSPCLTGHCDSNPYIACSDNGDCPSTFLTPGTCVTGGECWLERSVSCTTNADCPACVPAKGGGVTATPAASDDGEDIYMASVGCLSFPSVGNSDSIFKLDAATGAVDWVYRTEAIEPFQVFVAGPTYHDYGFLNGPILADVSDGMMGTTPVAVAGGKDGTIYAVNQATGLLEWSNVVAPAPTFAGFGLFNGSVAYDATSDRFFAALYDVDTYAPTNDHLLAFTGADGTVAWSEQIGQSWSSSTIANGLLLTGNLADAALLVHDVDTGAQLATLPVPFGNVFGGAAVENGVVYIPYGDVLGSGGVVAYGLP